MGQLKKSSQKKIEFQEQNQNENFFFSIRKLKSFIFEKKNSQDFRKKNHKKNDT